MKLFYNDCYFCVNVISINIAIIEILLIEIFTTTWIISTSDDVKLKKEATVLFALWVATILVIKLLRENLSSALERYERKREPVSSIISHDRCICKTTTQISIADARYRAMRLYSNNILIDILHVFLL